MAELVLIRHVNGRAVGSTSVIRAQLANALECTLPVGLVRAWKGVVFRLLEENAIVLQNLEDVFETELNDIRLME